MTISDEQKKFMREFRAPEHEHQWYPWLAYDPMAVEMGMTDSFRYRRTCAILGCYARERAEGLVSSGATFLDKDTRWADLIDPPKEG